MQECTGRERSVKQFIEYIAFTPYSKSVLYYSSAEANVAMTLKMKTWSILFVLLCHHRRAWLSIPDAHQ